MSIFAGSAPGSLRPYSSMARAYCLPRKINSSSFSRWAACFQTGMATVIMTAITLMLMSSTAMA